VADVFHEVDEQLRSAKYQTAVRASWPYAAALVIIAFLAWAGVAIYNHQQEAAEGRASQTYADGLQALAKSDRATAEADFDTLARSGPRGYKALALMQQAGLRLSADKPDEAASLLDAAAKVAPDQITADTARLKAAWLLMDKHPLAEIEQRLLPLTADKRPLRQLAREALALARLQAGHIQEARGDFEVISLSQDVSEAARARANAVLALIDSGGMANLAAALKITPPPLPTRPAPSAPALPAAPQAGVSQ
jgi:hypothetical protein